MTDNESLIGDLGAHAMMEAVQTQAAEIVGLPEEPREERFALIYRTLRDTAMEMGKERLQAEEAAAKKVDWTRSTVMIIEAGSGVD